MSNDRPQTYFEPPSESAPVIIEDYRRPVAEQPKPYPTQHQLVTTSPNQHQPEPEWIASDRDQTKMTGLRRWILRRYGDDDPVLHAAFRSVGWAFSAAISLTLASFLLNPAERATLTHLPDQFASWGIIILAMSAPLIASLLISLPSSLIDAFRARSNSSRSPRPQLANRLATFALVLAMLVITAIAIFGLISISHYVHGGN